MPNAKKASDPDASHFRKWTLGMLYAVEPELEVIAARTMARKRRGAKLNAYEDAKKAAWKLVGWYARDPRLRNSGAWDCYFRYILGELKI